jgi:ABC-type nitrate/sulfonate/bicarbonate transport system substrate-binding protein
MRGTIFAALVVALAAGDASAADTVRVGKGNPTSFSFIGAHVCMESGICAKHNLNLEISGFAGATRLHQGLAADQIDIALGSGPDMVFVAKGSPSKAIAKMAGPPLSLGIGVRPDAGINAVADLRGKKVAVSTLGSLTYWLTRQIGVRQGWGADGIATVELGTEAGQVSALKTKQVDGVTLALDAIYILEEKGEAKPLIRFGDVVKDFMMHAIYVTDKFAAKSPEITKRFLAAWFETIQYMRTHKAETVASYSKLSKVPQAAAARQYDAAVGMFTTDGYFDPVSLNVLAKSYVELKQLDAEPDMTKFYTEQFLPPKRPGS